MQLIDIRWLSGQAAKVRSPDSQSTGQTMMPHLQVRAFRNDTVSPIP